VTEKIQKRWHLRANQRQEHIVRFKNNNEDNCNVDARRDKLWSARLPHFPWMDANKSLNQLVRFANVSMMGQFI
jgi:hypothetical protein